jgi:hypothetical protein
MALSTSATALWTILSSSAGKARSNCPDQQGAFGLDWDHASISPGVALPETAQPGKSMHGLARVRDSDGALPPAHTAHHSHLGAGPDMDAGHSREEPGTGKPHARICEGESRMAELLDHDPGPSADSCISMTNSRI